MKTLVAALLLTLPTLTLAAPEKGAAKSAPKNADVKVTITPSSVTMAENGHAIIKATLDLENKSDEAVTVENVAAVLRKKGEKQPIAKTKPVKKKDRPEAVTIAPGDPLKMMLELELVPAEGMTIEAGQDYALVVRVSKGVTGRAKVTP